jgi:A/G-specific adenine glycosylase
VPGSAKNPATNPATNPVTNASTIPVTNASTIPVTNASTIPAPNPVAASSGESTGTEAKRDKRKRPKPDRFTNEFPYSELPGNDNEAFGNEAFDRERISLAWSWMQQHRRDLPWRETRDPWAVLVAELMLQQTQVSRVLDRWPTFLQQFPNPQAAANAGSAAIVTAWSGLGYNRRALALYQCATIVSERHNGTLPNTIDELQKLPGIGSYTARAVLAFAFAAPAAIVDTNVARIVARAFTGRVLSWKEAQQHADACVPATASAEWVWGWNQGMLDLGATICTKRAPSCDTCPIQTHCLWQLRKTRLLATPESELDPDPAIGSAGVGTKQSRFEGSDRQGRGRLIHALRLGPVHFDRVSGVMGWPDDHVRTDRVVNSLLKDGLVARSESTHAFTLA